MSKDDKCFLNYNLENEITLNEYNKLFDQGSQSIITFYSINDIHQAKISNILGINIGNIIVKKQYINNIENIKNKYKEKYFQFNNEIKFLLKLYKLDNFPILLYFNKKENYFYMNYCGDILSEYNKPTNYKEQLINIIDTLNTLNIYHNDIHINNFTVYNNNIYLIDFGWSSNIIDFPNLNITKEDIINSEDIIKELENKE